MPLRAGPSCPSHAAGECAGEAYPTTLPYYPTGRNGARGPSCGAASGTALVPGRGPLALAAGLTSCAELSSATIKPTRGASAAASGPLGSCGAHVNWPFGLPVGVTGLAAASGVAQDECVGASMRRRTVRVAQARWARCSGLGG
jgi:hypothetical protein